MGDSGLAFKSIGPIVCELLDKNQGSYKGDDPLGVSCSDAEITNFCLCALKLKYVFNCVHWSGSIRMSLIVCTEVEVLLCL